MSDSHQWSSAEHFIITRGPLFIGRNQGFIICWCSWVSSYQPWLQCISLELKHVTLLPCAISWLQSSVYCFYCSNDQEKPDFLPHDDDRACCQLLNLRSFFCPHHLGFHLVFAICLSKGFLGNLSIQEIEHASWILNIYFWSSLLQQCHCYISFKVLGTVSRLHAVQQLRRGGQQC